MYFSSWTVVEFVSGGLYTIEY